MALTSLTFLLFLLVLLPVYFLVPKRLQWVVLLCASVIFYLSCGIGSAVYILITSLSIYFASLRIDNLRKQKEAYLKEHRDLPTEEKKLYRQKIKTSQKRTLTAALLLNFGILCALKYGHFAIAQLNAVLGWAGSGGIDDHFSWVVPLGISFYTFQSIGYLLDVYWEKLTAGGGWSRKKLFQTTSVYLLLSADHPGAHQQIRSAGPPALCRTQL